MSEAIVEISRFIYEKCKEYRMKGENKKCLDLFNCYLKLKSCDVLGLRLTPNVGENGLLIQILEEFNIFSYYSDMRIHGSIISDRILFSSYNNFERDTVVRNQRFYFNKLISISKYKVTAKCNKDYVNLNASIVKVEDGYILNSRTVNYYLTEDGDYIVATKEDYVNTINYILIMNKEYQIITQYTLVDKSTSDIYPSKVRGLEDIIIFHVNKKELWFTCTTRDTNPSDIPQISL